MRFLVLLFLCFRVTFSLSAAVWDSTSCQPVRTCVADYLYDDTRQANGIVNDKTLEYSYDTIVLSTNTSFKPQYNLALVAEFTWLTRALPTVYDDYDVARYFVAPKNGVNYGSIPDEHVWRYNRYLDDPAKGNLAADDWYASAQRAWANNGSGNGFEVAVREALGSSGSKTNIGGHIPDLPVGLQYGVTDVKDVIDLSLSPQLRSFAKHALDNDLPFNPINLIDPWGLQSQQAMNHIRDTLGGGNDWLNSFNELKTSDALFGTEIEYDPHAPHGSTNLNGTSLTLTEGQVRAGNRVGENLTNAVDGFGVFAQAVQEL